MVHAEILRQVANRTLSGVSIAPELVFNNLNRKMPVGQRLEPSKDIVLVLSNNFYLSKGSSVLSEPFDKHIQMYQETGLIKAWVRKYAAKIKVRNKLDKRHPKKLHVKNVLGAVYIFGVFSFLSIIVFIVELFKGKCVILECFIDYFTY